MALFANDACGQPIPWEHCCPWMYFDGKLFQTKLIKASREKVPLIDLCDGQVRSCKAWQNIQCTEFWFISRLLRVSSLLRREIQSGLPIGLSALFDLSSVVDGWNGILVDFGKVNWCPFLIFLSLETEIWMQLWSKALTLSWKLSVPSFKSSFCAKLVSQRTKLLWCYNEENC